MIGGIVTATKIVGAKVWVDCEERNSTSKCAIYVERNSNSEAIRPGDKLWWQGGWAMWTPFACKPSGKCGIDYDIKIPRIGFSGVKRP